MTERKPSAATLAIAVNLSPVNPLRKTGRFATDFYDKFDGEPSKAAAKGVKFERETVAKTPALPQIKFDQSAGSKREQFSLTNLTDQAVRTTNQTLANLTSSERSEAYVKFSFKFNQKALK